MNYSHSSPSLQRGSVACFALAVRFILCAYGFGVGCILCAFGVGWILCVFGVGSILCACALGVLFIPCAFGLGVMFLLCACGLGVGVFVDLIRTYAFAFNPITDLYSLSGQRSIASPLKHTLERQFPH
jgi:hypothetical protein